MNSLHIRDEKVRREDGITRMQAGMTMDGPTGLPLTESDFHQRVDAVLARIESTMDDVVCDIDAEFNGGVLTLTFENETKVIVNRQTPNREIWVAAKSGGFHFKFDGHAWLDTRSHEPLEVLLSRVVSEQSGHVISITLA